MKSLLLLLLSYVFTLTSFRLRVDVSVGRWGVDASDANASEGSPYILPSGICHQPSGQAPYSMGRGRPIQLIDSISSLLFSLSLSLWSRVQIYVYKSTCTNRIVERPHGFWRQKISRSSDAAKWNGNIFERERRLRLEGVPWVGKQMMADGSLISSIMRDFVLSKYDLHRITPCDIIFLSMDR